MTAKSAASKTAAKEEKVFEFVKHNPMPGYSERFISKADWESLGIDQEDTTWDAANRFRIPAEEFSAKALNYLKADGGFEIVTD